MGISVFCIAASESQATDIVSPLRHAGFSNNDISVLLPDRSGTRDFAHQNSTKASEGAATGAGAGGAVGGELGLLAGIGVLAIPGLGPFIAAGPIMAALSGAAVGGLAGVLIGLGIPELEAKRYEGKVKDGILISAHSENAEETKSAKRVFESAGATDIATSSEKSAPKSEVRPYPRDHATI